MAPHRLMENRKSSLICQALKPDSHNIYIARIVLQYRENLLRTRTFGKLIGLSLNHRPRSIGKVIHTKIQTAVVAIFILMQLY